MRKIIKDKRGMDFKSAFFSAIVVSMIVISVGTIMDSWGENYGSSASYDLQEYNSLDQFSKEANQNKEQITPQDPDQSGTSDFEGRIFRGGYGILGRIFSPFTTIFNMLESLETRFGLPSYVIEGVLTMIVFSIIFTIVAIIFRLGRNSV